MARITVLMDNLAVYPGTVSEHGLSLLIERDGASVVFDTGKSWNFLVNAHALGLFPASASALVLSHAHYDHTGGVKALYGEAGFRGPLWTGPGFFDPRFSRDPEGLRALGPGIDGAWLAANGIQWKTIAAEAGKTAVAEIVPGVFAVNGFTALHGIEAPESRFLAERDGVLCGDDFRDELCLVVPGKTQLTVITGCAHRGLMNTLDAVKAAFDKPVSNIIGGAHLREAGEERIARTAAYLRESGIELAAFGHCTGDRAATVFGGALQGYRMLSTGAHFIVES